MLDVMLSLLSVGKEAYDFVSDIRRGDPNKEVVAELKLLNQKVEKLSDHIWYAPGLQLVHDTSINRQHVLTDLREVRQSLEPVQQVMNDDILASAMILTPDKMKQALHADPWDVLVEIRPLNLARPHTNSSMVPILFERDGIRYVGWQTRGALPMLFNCEYNPDLKLILPHKPALVTPQPLVGAVAHRHVPPTSPIAFEWVKIPAGEFIMGSDESKDKDAFNKELPQHRIHLPDYWIAKTPVTVAQFAQFVKAKNYKTAAEIEGKAVAYDGRKWDWLIGADWTHPHGPLSDIKQKANHPVTCVSWTDVLAFCRWANVRLPTEAEWEKAARSTDGRIYPWGNEALGKSRCNFDMNENDTTPVGNYPKGVSPYGCLDMAGNVYEWTSTKWLSNYEDYANKANNNLDGDGNRVMRGGSFVDALREARCTARDFGEGLWFNFVGFRVAWSPGS